MGGARARCPTLRDSKTRGKWTFTRARGELCANRPQVVQGTCAPTGAARLCPPDALRVIRGRSSGSGETRATELPKPSAAVFAQVRLAANCTPARASLRDSLSLGGYALGFPPWAGVSPSPWTLPLRGEAGRWPALVVARGAAMPRQRDLESAAEDISANCLALARRLTPSRGFGAKPHNAEVEVK